MLNIYVLYIAKKCMLFHILTVLARLLKTRFLTKLPRLKEFNKQLKFFFKFILNNYLCLPGCLIEVIHLT